MSGPRQERCRSTVEEIWSSWPRFNPSQEVLRHAAGCPSCRAELESLRALCQRSSGADEEPLSWAKVLPASRWARAAAATRARLKSPPRPLLWAPALALAAALLFVWNTRSRVHKAAPAVPAEVLENLELLERLDLLDNMDMLENMPARKRES